DLPILRNHSHLRLFVAGFSFKPRQTLLADEQFLHGSLSDLVFFGYKLLQGFDEGIRITQGLGDSFLFGFGRRESDDRLVQIVSIDPWNAAFSTMGLKVDCSQ